MKIDRSSSIKLDVKKVAQLSNLTLVNDEEKEFEKQLGEVLNYIEKLNSIDTSEVEPTAQVTGLSNITRNDKFSDESLSQKDAISGGQSTYNNLFVVKKLVETT